MKPGTRVRLVADPGRVGVTTGESRKLAGKTYWQVTFPDTTDYLLEAQLEVVEGLKEDPLELLRRGKFGRARDLRGNVTYIRLNGRLANLIYSMETTNTDYYPYQFKPVLNFLESPSGGLLIADEVGLGKTIEAGLIWTELRSRFDTRRLMVLCPAMLRNKWQLELKRRFGIDAEIAGPAEALGRLREYRRGDILGYSLICSMQGLRPRKNWEDDDANHRDASQLACYIHDNEYDDPLFDLVVIDEAHYLRNPESMTSKLGRLLRPVTEHLLLLSATPIHLRSEDLYHLLNLVDQDTFDQPRVFDEILQANEPLVAAHNKILKQPLSSNELLQYLTQAAAQPFLRSNRQLASLIESIPGDEELQENQTRSQVAHQLESINLLSKAVTRTRKRDVKDWRVLREAVPEPIELSPPEESLYWNLTNLVREYCEVRDISEGFLLSTPQRQLSSSMPAALAEWMRRGESLDDILYEDLGIDDLPRNVGPLVHELATKASALADLDTIRANDSKYSRLREMLLQFFSDHGSEKIVLFAYFKPTLRYLNERLEAEGIRCMLLVGGLEQNKQEIIDEFQDNKDARILLSSEVASEGVDLQFCRVIINYDLPWNPMKVEQRIGRLDRIGQKAEKITIWNLFYSQTIDDRIYRRLYTRLGVFERALGGLEAILGEQIQILTRDLLSGNLTPEQEEERIEQTAQALTYIQEEENRLEDEAGNLIAHGDYILNQVQAAKDLGRLISGEDLQIYICDFFAENFTGCSFVRKQSDELAYDVQLSREARAAFGDFLKERKLLGSTRLAAHLAKPVYCEFKNKVQGEGIGRKEIISQFHPLTRFVAEQIKEREIRYHPVIAASLSRQNCPSVPKGCYIFSVHQWSVEGMRAIERLYIAAVNPDRPEEFLDEGASEKLLTTAARNGKDWIAAANQLDLDEVSILAEHCITRQLEEYDKFILALENENADRADIQRQSLERHRERQQDIIYRQLEAHRANKREGLIKASEGRLTALENRVSDRLREIENNRKLKHHAKEICLGVIKLE